MLYSEIIVNNSHHFKPHNLNSNDLNVINIEKDKNIVLYNNKKHLVKIVKKDFLNKTYQLLIENTVYEVKIKNHIDTLISKIGFTENSNQNLKVLKAPMPGVILKILVAKNEKIEKGKPLVIMEAMKMENSLMAPKNATIKSIEVNTGEKVDKNQILITFK